MRMDIKKKNNHWMVNDKRLAEMNTQEAEFMNQFFKEMKIDTEDPEVGYFINRKASEQSASIKYHKFQNQ